MVALPALLWFVAVLVSLLAAWVIYAGIGAAGQNFARISGKGYQFGGAAALFITVLFLSKSFIPSYEQIKLKEYDLRLNLIFPENDQASPFNTSVHAFVRKKEDPSAKPYRFFKVDKGVGGIVVHFDKLGTGDKLYVITEEGGKTWRSDDMITPTAHLKMNRL